MAFARIDEMVTIRQRMRRQFPESSTTKSFDTLFRINGTRQTARRDMTAMGTALIRSMEPPPRAREPEPVRPHALAAVKDRFIAQRALRAPTGGQARPHEGLRTLPQGVGAGVLTQNEFLNRTATPQQQQVRRQAAFRRGDERIGTLLQNTRPFTGEEEAVRNAILGTPNFMGVREGGQRSLLADLLGNDAQPRLQSMVIDLARRDPEFREAVIAETAPTGDDLSARSRQTPFDVGRRRQLPGSILKPVFETVAPVMDVLDRINPVENVPALQGLLGLIESIPTVGPAVREGIEFATHPATIGAAYIPALSFFRAGSLAAIGAEAGIGFTAGVGAHYGRETGVGEVGGALVGALSPIVAARSSLRVVRSLEEATRNAVNHGIVPEGFAQVGRVFEVPQTATSSAGNRIIIPSPRMTEQELRIRGGAVDDAAEFEQVLAEMRRAIDEEEAIRASGVARQEISQARGERFGGLKPNLIEGEKLGLSGEALTDYARHRLRGPMRTTLPGAVPHTPAQRTQVSEMAKDMFMRGDISEPQWTQLTGRTGILARILDGGSIEPGEWVLASRVLGRDLVDAARSARPARMLPDPDVTRAAAGAARAVQVRKTQVAGAETATEDIVAGAIRGTEPDSELGALQQHRRALEEQIRIERTQPSALGGGNLAGLQQEHALILSRITDREDILARAPGIDAPASRRAAREQMGEFVDPDLARFSGATVDELRAVVAQMDARLEEASALGGRAFTDLQDRRDAVSLLARRAEASQQLARHIQGDIDRLEVAIVKAREGGAATRSVRLLGDERQVLREVLSQKRAVERRRSLRVARARTASVKEHAKTAGTRTFVDEAGVLRISRPAGYATARVVPDFPSLVGDAPTKVRAEQTVVARIRQLESELADAPGATFATQVAEEERASLIRELKIFNDGDARDLRDIIHHNYGRISREGTRLFLAEKRAEARLVDEVGRREILDEFRATPGAIEKQGLDYINTLTADPELRAELSRVVRYWQAKVDAMTEFIGDNDRSWGAFFSGATGNNLVNTMVNQKRLLQTVFRSVGFTDAQAREASLKLFDAQLAKRFPGATLKNDRIDMLSLPDDIAKAVRQHLPQTYANDWNAARLFVQRFKNTMFGIFDIGVFGIQLPVAITLGGPVMALSLMNRALGFHSSPRAMELYLTNGNGAGIRKEIRNILDGLHSGQNNAIFRSTLEDTDQKVGSVLEYFGAAGKTADQPFMKIADKFTAFQFGYVLGGARNLVYEGNLMMSRMLGENIDDPLVRQRAANSANAITSYANTAIRPGRRTAEEILFTSAAMTRAQFTQIQSMAKLLGPNASRGERGAAAMMIASWAGSIMLAHKAINDVVGFKEFEFDPSKPGFGIVNLPFGVSFNIFPQQTLRRTIARSFRELIEGDWTPEELAQAWGKFALGRGSVVGAVGGRALGAGFVEGQGISFDPGEQTLGGAALALVPLPPIFQSMIEDGMSLERLALEGVGLSAFETSPTTKADIDLRRSGKIGYFDLELADREAYRVAHQELAQEMDDDATGKAATYIGRLNSIRQTQEAQDANLLGRRNELGEIYTAQKWRREHNDNRGAAVEAYLSAFPENRRIEKEPDPADDPLKYYAWLFQENRLADGDIVWGKVDAALAALDQDIQDFIDRNSGVSRRTDTEKRYRTAVKLLDGGGFFDTHDIAWGKVQSFSTEAERYDTYELWAAAETVRLEDIFQDDPDVRVNVANMISAHPISSQVRAIRTHERDAWSMRMIESGRLNVVDAATEWDFIGVGEDIPDTILAQIQFGRLLPQN